MILWWVHSKCEDEGTAIEWISCQKTCLRGPLMPEESFTHSKILCTCLMIKGMWVTIVEEVKASYVTYRDYIGQFWWLGQ